MNAGEGASDMSNVSQTRNSVESIPSITSRGGKSNRTTAKAKNKLRRNNREFATLEDAIMKQEEAFKATMVKDLENCAYFPPRPSMKFFPTPHMTHMLLHQAMQLQHKNLDAPDEWKLKYDEPE